MSFFLQKYPKIKLSNGSLHSKHVLAANSKCISHPINPFEYLAHLADLSITCNYIGKVQNLHFIQMGTDFDCLGQIQKLKILMEAK